MIDYTKFDVMFMDEVIASVDLKPEEVINLMLSTT